MHIALNECSVKVHTNVSMKCKALRKVKYVLIFNEKKTKNNRPTDNITIADIK